MATPIPQREFIYDKKGKVVNILPFGVTADTAARLTGSGPVGLAAKIAESLVGVKMNIPKPVLHQMEQDALDNHEYLSLNSTFPQLTENTSRQPVIANASMTPAIAPSIRDQPRWVANPHHINNLASSWVLGRDMSFPVLSAPVSSQETNQIMAITMASPVFDVRKKRDSSTLVNTPTLLTPTSYFSSLPGTVDLRQSSIPQSIRVLTQVSNMPLSQTASPNDTGAITSSTQVPSEPPSTPTPTAAITRFYRTLRQGQGQGRHH
jgi:hypothetical protein